MVGLVEEAGMLSCGFYARTRSPSIWTVTVYVHPPHDMHVVRWMSALLPNTPPSATRGALQPTKGITMHLPDGTGAPPA